MHRHFDTGQNRQPNLTPKGHSRKRQAVNKRGCGDLDLADKMVSMVLETDFAKGNFLSWGAEGIFRAYDGRVWAPLSTEALKLHFYQAVGQIGAPVRRSTQLLDDAVELARIKCSSHGADPFRLSGAPRNVINLENGEIWLKPDGSHELRSHRYDSYLTVCLDFPYGPEARCPTYGRAMREIFRDSRDRKSLIRFWHEFLGYAISADRSKRSFQYCLAQETTARRHWPTLCAA